MKNIYLRSFTKIQLFLGVICLAAFLQAQEKPNIIIIFTDDQGYGDLGCFGAKHVSTPRIDQMAEEGAKLTSFYMAAAVCTPSRAALMTASYPTRVGMAAGVNLAADKKGLNPEEITIAEVLKSAGYKTGMFGKWHLGDQPEFLPTRQGFDEFYGLPYSHDIHPYHQNQKKYNFPALPLLEGEEVIELNPNADLFTKNFTQRAVSFIEKHKEEPFFLYLAHPIPHRPLHMSEPFMKDLPPGVEQALAQEGGKINYPARDKLYKQAIDEIDWSVGQILDTLKQQGLDENTLVIFTSDNGPSKGVRLSTSGILSGTKGSTLEGGSRVPTVVRWPGKISSGQTIDEMMSAMDLLPTFAGLVGAKLPQDRVLDGKDILTVLTDEAATPHKALFYHQGNALKAVRSGAWKLHVKNGKPHQLFNLDTDIGEKKNVIKDYPEEAAMLLAQIKAFEKDIKENSRPAAFINNPKPLTITN